MTMTKSLTTEVVDNFTKALERYRQSRTAYFRLHDKILKLVSNADFAVNNLDLIEMLKKDLDEYSNELNHD